MLHEMICIQGGCEDHEENCNSQIHLNLNSSFEVGIANLLIQICT